MDDNLCTADKGCPKRVRPCNPLNFRPLIIRQVPQPKRHGPAPKQTGMILQQTGSMTISVYLPDAPLSSDSMIVPQMLLGTFMVDGMNRLLDSVVEFIGGGESQVSQEMTLEVAPGALDVIEFRGVLG